MSGRRDRRLLSGCLVAAATMLAAGCDLPRDPEGTLERVEGGTLRVGVTTREPWTNWIGDGGDRRPTGIEVELAERFADELNAEIVWVRGSESQLLTSLETFHLDLVLGGMTDDSPWSDRIGLSRCYAETGVGRHVLAVPPGENGFLLRLDRFLARNEAAVRREIDAEGATLRKGRLP